jgi:hypothetical protein
VGELEKTLTEDRNHGRRDAWHDLELQRMRAMYKLSNPKAIEMDVINVISERLVPNSNADDWERAAGLDRLEVVLSCLPEENAVRIRQEQHRVGLITDEELREHIINYAKLARERATKNANELAERMREMEEVILRTPETSQFVILDDLSGTDE